MYVYVLCVCIVLVVFCVYGVCACCFALHVRMVHSSFSLQFMLMEEEVENTYFEDANFEQVCACVCGVCVCVWLCACGAVCVRVCMLCVCVSMCCVLSVCLCLCALTLPRCLWCRRR